MVGIFSPAEIAALRADVEASMTETATVIRLVQVSDSGGGYTTERQTIATVPVLRMPEVAGAGDAFVAGQGVQGLRWKLFVPFDTDVRDEDEVAIGTDAYTVLAVASPATAEAARLLYALKL